MSEILPKREGRNAHRCFRLLRLLLLDLLFPNPLESSLLPDFVGDLEMGEDVVVLSFGGDDDGCVLHQLEEPKEGGKGQLELTPLQLPSIFPASFPLSLVQPNLKFKGYGSQRLTDFLA